MTRARGALAALAWAACVSAPRPGAEMPRSESVARAIRVDIAEFKFAPQEAVATVGDTVLWVNGDSFAHTATADSAAWSSPELAQGKRFVWVARRPGRFPYHCTAHPVMRGVLVVRQ